MGEPFKTASTRIEVRPTGISKTTGGRTSCLPLPQLDFFRRAQGRGLRRKENATQLSDI